MKFTAHPTHPPGKIQLNRVNDALDKLRREHTTTVRKTGIIGCTEGINRESSYCSSTYIFCGENPTREDVSAAWQRLGKAVNWVVSSDNAAQLVQLAELEMPALIAARPVKDERVTAEAHAAAEAERKAASEKAEAERKAREQAEHAPFINLYAAKAESRKQKAEMEQAGPEAGAPQSSIRNPQSAIRNPQSSIPEGMLAITASLKYDNSDAMTDYFSSHCQIGPAFLIGLVPKGTRQTESLARSIVARHPLLAAETFKWHTENYSGGHGNYLDGQCFELPAEIVALGKQLYRGGTVTTARWQIEFGRCWGTVVDFISYDAKADSSQLSALSHTSSSGGATMSLNSAHNGVEISFPAKPEASTIADLKLHGFRWSMRSKCWYHKQTPAAIAYAQRITGTSTETGSAPAGPDRFDMAVEDRMAEACGC